MKRLLTIIPLFLFVGYNLFAQPYSSPPYLSSDISASRNYDLTGKKFYISQVNYNTILPSDYNAQKEAFVRYLEESLILRGATPSTDSLNADFLVNAEVNFGDESYEHFNLTNKKLESRDPSNSTYLFNPSGSSSDSKSDNITVTETYKGKTYVVDGKMMYPKTSKNCFKAILVEAYELADGTRNKLWITQALDSRGDFKFLASDCAMVYLMMRAYGNDMKMRRCLISDEDSYYALFANSNMPADIHFLPYCQSTDNNLNVFLVKKSDEGLVCLVEDNNLLSMDLKHKNYRAAVKIGDQTINSSKVFYDVRPVKFSRFLTLVFPVNGEDFQSFDIVFSKKNNPEKIKLAITGIRLN